MIVYHDPYIRPLVEAVSSFFGANDEFDTVDSYCDAYTARSFNSTYIDQGQMDFTYIKRGVYLFLAVFSIIGLTVVALTIFYNDKLN